VIPKKSVEHKTMMGSVRRMMLFILVFGLLGTAAELLLLSHVEGALQLIPLILMLAALLVIGWHLLAGTRSSLRAMRVSMLAFVLAGAVGVGLHYRGSMEFQTEVDPELAGFALFKKVMTSKAPPALAPGIMVQLGLLGLAYTWRYPVTSGNN
jgi:cation transport ATPase